MSITVGARGVAEVTIPAVYLRRIMGAYDLIFMANVRVLPRDTGAHEAILWGADAKVRSASVGEQPLGHVRLIKPLRIVPEKYERTVQVEFVTSLSSLQIEMIEEIRSGGDLWFRLGVCAEGREGGYEQTISNQWDVHLPRSQWIAQLRNVGALDILLLETAFPLHEVPQNLAKARAYFVEAQQHYANGEYRAAVAACRQVLEELGAADWATTTLDRFIKDRKTTTKTERADLIASAVYNYTHQAHHSESEGGAAYNKADAKLALAITAAIFSHRLSS